ncbi:hypothetical protein [Streptomyces sp. NPDC003090]|uniref:hypothetical protein n=1 Tax=Streptomyces sp. NPDC003090 TaxID=3154274 RepID=UPI0037FA5A2A
MRHESEQAGVPVEGREAGHVTWKQTDEATPDQRRLIDVAVEYWRRMVPRDAPLAVELLPEDGVVVVSHAVRGGGRIYVASDESVLFAASGAPPHEAIEVFRSGRRTPPGQFRPRGGRASAGAPAEELFTLESLPRLEERLRALAVAMGHRKELMTSRQGDQLLHLGDFETWHDLVPADGGYAVRVTDRGRTRVLGTATRVEDAARLFVVVCGMRLHTDGLSAAELRARIPAGVDVVESEGGEFVVEWTDGGQHRVTVQGDYRAYPFAASVGRSLDAMLGAPGGRRRR